MDLVFRKLFITFFFFSSGNVSHISIEVIAEFLPLERNVGEFMKPLGMIGSVQVHFV